MKICKIFYNVIKKHRSINYIDIDYKDVKEILKEDRKALLIDVRSEQEFEEGHLEGSINIPIYELKENYKKISEASAIIVYCQSGIRSRKAIKILKEKGFKNIYELKGGLDEM